MNYALEIRGLTKDYPVFRKPSEGFGYLWHAIAHGKLRVPQDRPAVRALERVDLTVKPGERVGIIGRNGAGKSTLLKLLSGDFPASAGEIRIQGEVYSLLPGSVTFADDLSARENAVNHLRFHRLDDAEIAERIADIETFTELGEYFDQPVKNYSLGMRVRAEFAVATAVHADIIVIDEVLGAGDIYWTGKIAARMDALCEQGVTLLLVSHSLDQIMRFCDRAIWIERGQVVMDGPVDEVTIRYESFLERLAWHTDDADDKTINIAAVLPDLGSDVLPDSGQTVVRWPGRGGALISGVWFDDEPATEVEVAAGQPLTMRIASRAIRRGSYALRYLVTFWAPNGKRLAVVENDVAEVALAEGARHEVTVTIAADQLLGARYAVTISLFDLSEHQGSQELLNRLDVIYKSFHVRFVGSQPPVYKLQFENV